jgi:hypothetical protein
MKLDLICNNKKVKDGINTNDEYYTHKYAILPITKYLKPFSKVWCPFDTSESQYVKVLKSQGFDVSNSHISNGIDFLNEDLSKRDSDYIISNPPYSLKNEILEKLFNSGKSFAMLMGVVGIFESQKRFNLFKNNNFEVMYFNKRVNYFSPFNENINPPFSSVYICRNILPRQIIFEPIEKHN